MSSAHVGVATVLYGANDGHHEGGHHECHFANSDEGVVGCKYEAGAEAVEADDDAEGTYGNRPRYQADADVISKLEFHSITPVCVAWACAQAPYIIIHPLYILSIVWKMLWLEGFWGSVRGERDERWVVFAESKNHPQHAH